MKLSPRVLAVVAVSVLVLGNGELLAYERYTDGCDNCHGGSRSSGYRSQRDDHLWPDSLHNLHRSSSFMDTDCGACHIEDGDDPRTYRSRDGLSCLGCHGRMEGDAVTGAGLRQHHRLTGASRCAGCHEGDEATVPESVLPPNWGTARARVSDPCNLDAVGKEDYSGDGLGLDNDGDRLYDEADDDCGHGGTPPQAAFRFTQMACTLSVESADESTDPEDGGEVVAWEWDFDGDGSVDATDANPVWEFPEAGDHAVELTVEDDLGLRGSITHTVAVVPNAPPVAGLMVTVSGMTIECVERSSDSDGTITSRTWSFGDGETSTDLDPTHIYEAAGTYTVTIEVADDCDQAASVSTEITVAGSAPTFLRGDPNHTGSRDISDGVFVLGFLFLGTEAPSCMKAADTDDDGNVSLNDAIFLLNFLFLGGSPPREPFGVCGADLTDDALSCESFSGCG